MTRIPLVDPNDPASGSNFEEMGLGSVHPNVYRAIANHPDALRVFAEFGRTVYFDSRLTAAERELAYLTASVVNNCHY